MCGVKQALKGQFEEMLTEFSFFVNYPFTKVNSAQYHKVLFQYSDELSLFLCISSLSCGLLPFFVGFENNIFLFVSVCCSAVLKPVDIVSNDNLSLIAYNVEQSTVK